jgi:hypothetical protein
VGRVTADSNPPGVQFFAIQAEGGLTVVECARPVERPVDAESADWLRRLSAGGALRGEAEAELHGRLVRIALAEVSRRAGSTPVAGPELADVAHQAADDVIGLAAITGSRDRGQRDAAAT